MNEELDPEAALLRALGPETDEAPEETQEETQASAEEAPAEETPEETPEAPETFKITVKGDDGADVEQEVTLDELAKGYMLQADYTRKTQALSKERDTAVAESSSAIAKAQQSAIESINQLQELVIQQAAPELSGVDWVSLSVNDPARFVQLQAKQQQIQSLYGALEQQKAQFAQQQEQAIEARAAEILKASEDLLKQGIPDLDSGKVEGLLKTVEKAVGWAPQDIRYAVRAMAQAGMKADTLGKIMLAVHKAAQFDELSTKSKPAALQKVAQAPRAIKPAAPVPRRENQEALKRLQKAGRIEDFVKFL